ncbi:hypothetical protein [Mongoliibacter ruber]|uniref:DUF3575 domain-containing protein n=1 Tax=Mongoliibacter ruber TaxID=1750599 RepID=A0A2T0WHX8_9BACT|nr:hypothetical protein [Mongoliibacter ruber]PRY86262.1 hypothetical protein CLW00_109108 [Mongoliibacter ruber]
MKYTAIIILFIVLSAITFESEAQTVDLWKLNLITPSLEFEKSLSPKITLAQKAGITYSGSHPPLTEPSISTGLLLQLAPFYDIQARRYYNFEKRKAKGKSIENNNGNYLTLRAQYVGPEITASFVRYSPHTFKIGPHWGLQRNEGVIQYYFNIGPAYIFDDIGNSAIWPIEFEFRLGWLLKKKNRGTL